MSKRVHELAKELDRTNKEVIAALAEKNVEVKSHMSVLSEEQEAMVKKALAPKKEETEAKETAARPEGTAGKQEGAAAAPPKKKKIIAVYNAHNSQTGIKDPRVTERAAGPSRDAVPREEPGRQELEQRSLRPEAERPVRPERQSPRRPVSAQGWLEQPSSLQHPRLRSRHRRRAQRPAGKDGTVRSSPSGAGGRREDGVRPERGASGSSPEPDRKRCGWKRCGPSGRRP